MIRLFLYLVVVLGLGFLFAWVADRPGDIAVNWQGQRYETSLMVAMSLLVALIAVILIIWAIIRAILNSPTIMTRFFKTRRRDRGYKALSQGMIAASSGNAVRARQLAKESSKLLSNEPLVDLLDAQTSLLEGKRENARAQYSKMLENDNTRLLALRGLYVEAEREGAGEAARQYASEAVALEPSLPWAGSAVLRYHSIDGNWEEALSRLGSNKAAGLLDKDTAAKQRAVLLTAQAFEEEQANPDRAAKLAQQAHKLDGELVPAAIIGARAYGRSGDIRRASKLIEAVWRKSPHPELAEAYTHVRSGDSVLDRLKRAKHLASLKSNHPEGNIAVAHAAIDAMDWKEARNVMQPVITGNLTERSCLIMADIEEGEHGDRGRMRDWLSRAVRAPRDRVWTADGYVSDNWLPISPISGEVGAFEWRVPVEQLGAPQDVIDVSELAKPLGAPEKTDEEETRPVGETASVAVSSTGAATAILADSAAVADDADKKPQIGDNEKDAVPANSGDNDPSKAKDAEVIILDEARETEVAGDQEKTGQNTSPIDEKDGDIVDAEIIQSEDKAAEPVKETSEELDNKVEFPLKRRPDDPGVRPGQELEPKKFKLF